MHVSGIPPFNLIPLRRHVALLSLLVAILYLVSVWRNNFADSYELSKGTYANYESSLMGHQSSNYENLAYTTSLNGISRQSCSSCSINSMLCRAVM